MEEVQGFFPQEETFLNQICEKIAQESELGSVTVDVFLIEGDDEENKKQMYHKVLGDELEVQSDNSHILFYLEMIHKDKSFCVDIYGCHDSFVCSKWSFLATGIARAIDKFRGGEYEYVLYKQIRESKKVRLPITTYMAMETVDTLLKKDKDYQFFRKLSKPYVRGYFEKVDFLGMGASMVIAVKRAICAHAEKQGDKGVFSIEVEPYEEQMRRAFGDLDEDNGGTISSLIRFTKSFKINDANRTTLRAGVRDEICLKWTYECEDAGEVYYRPLISVAVSIWTLEGALSEEYKRLILVSVLKYVELWCELTMARGYKIEITKQRFQF